MDLSCFFAPKPKKRKERDEAPLFSIFNDTAPPKNVRVEQKKRKERDEAPLFSFFNQSQKKKRKVSCAAPFFRSYRRARARRANALTFVAGVGASRRG